MAELKQENEIDEYLASIKAKPLKYIISALIFGLMSSTTFWLWFYNNKIEDIQRAYEMQIKNLEFQVSINETVKSPVFDSTQESSKINEKGYIVIDPNSEMGKKIYNSINKK